MLVSPEPVRPHAAEEMRADAGCRVKPYPQTLLVYTQALLATAAGRRLLEGWPQYAGGVVGPEQTAGRRTQVRGACVEGPEPPYEAISNS